MDENTVIPAGSMPPEPVQETVVEAQQEEAPKVFAGKYKSPEELETAYSELQKTMGRQSGELGELRGKASAYEQMLSKQQAPAQNMAAQAPDYEGMLSTLAKQYEAGDITFEEALRKSSHATAQQITGIAKDEISRLREEFGSTLQQTLAERDAQERIKSFHKSNPDYNEVLKSGALDAIKQENPMHDDFSAFYAFKAAEAGRKAQEEASRVREGSKVTDKVLTKPGTSIQHQNKTKTNDQAKLRESMMRRLESVED